jgi:hypothetical protein
MLPGWSPRGGARRCRGSRALAEVVGDGRQHHVQLKVAGLASQGDSEVIAGFVGLDSSGQGLGSVQKIPQLLGHALTGIGLHPGQQRHRDHDGRQVGCALGLGVDLAGQ